jgi:hypothetical protein
VDLRQLLAATETFFSFSGSWFFNNIQHQKFGNEKFTKVRILNVDSRKSVSSGVIWTSSGGSLIYFAFEWKFDAGSVFYFFRKPCKSSLVLGVVYCVTTRIALSERFSDIFIRVLRASAEKPI